MELSQYLHDKQKKYLIFDLDETILRLRLPWNSYLDPIREKLLAQDPLLYQDYTSGRISLATLENRLSEKGPDMIQLIKAHNEKFEQKLEGIDVNQNLVNFIKVDNTHTNYIWSSNSRATIEKVLKDIDILQKFEKLVTRDDVDFIKPYPDGFQKIYIEGAALADYLFIGDSDADEGVSKKIGINFFLVDYFKLIA